LGTLQDPIIVPSFGHHERIVGCSGYPIESHELTWLSLSSKRKAWRCRECGGAYSLDVTKDLKYDDRGRLIEGQATAHAHH